METQQQQQPTEIGQLFFAADLGEFLVWGIEPCRGNVDIYVFDTGDLGRLSLAEFREGVECGRIRWRAALAETVRCPTCRGALTLVSDGQINGEPAPFVACSACAFCEEL